VFEISNGQLSLSTLDQAASFVAAALPSSLQQLQPAVHIAYIELMQDPKDSDVGVQMPIFSKPEQAPQQLQYHQQPIASRESFYLR
jgi:hypothetical protein